MRHLRLNPLKLIAEKSSVTQDQTIHFPRPLEAFQTPISLTEWVFSYLSKAILRWLSAQTVVPSTCLDTVFEIIHLPLQYSPEFVFCSEPPSITLAKKAGSW